MNHCEFPELERLGSNLKKYRRKCHLTQDALAYRAGYHRTYISALERGKINPTVSTLAAIARELGIDLIYLLMDDQRLG